jgi:hypothetical protein
MIIVEKSADLGAGSGFAVNHFPPLGVIHFTVLMPCLLICTVKEEHSMTLNTHSFIFFPLSGILGFEPRASHLQGRRSTA